MKESRISFDGVRGQVEFIYLAMFFYGVRDESESVESVLDEAEIFL